MMGITDIHQHILWGMDDGPQRPEDMHAMLRAARRQGVKRIAATPHVHPGFRPFDIGLYRDRLWEAQEYCDRTELGITMMQGAEVAWTYHTVQALRMGQIPTLNGGDCVLLELWHDVGWSEIRSAVKKLQHAGYTPVLAHVERYRCFVWQPEKALRLRRETDVRYQLNASTILQPGGPIRSRFLRRMLEDQGIDAVASDAHDCDARPMLLGNAFAELQKRCPADYACALVNFNGVLS